MIPRARRSPDSPSAISTPQRENPTDAARNQARHWLKSLHVSAKPQLVEELALLLPLYPKKTALGFYAGRLLQKGKVPTEEAMLKFLWAQLEVLLDAIRALEAHQGRDPFIPPEAEAEILRWIDAYWEKRREGPLWSELGEHFHWSCSQRRRFIHYLAARGLVTFTAAPRSLRRSDMGRE